MFSKVLTAGVAAGILAGSFALATPALAQDVSPEWQKVVDAAKAEGTVTLYSSQGLKQLNDMAERFKAKYGIDVQIVRGVETDFVPKLDVEFNSGKGIADVVVQTSLITLADQEAKGYYVPVIGPSFDNPDYKRAERAPRDVTFEVSASILTFSWNTELWPQGLKDYSDALNPELEGEIGISLAKSSTQVDYYLYLMENYGEDFVDRLAELKPRVYPGALPMSQALSSGEVSVIIYGEAQIDEKAAGAPVESSFAAKPWGARFYGNVLKTAPQPNAAQLLADFMVTEEAQIALARKAGSVLPNIPGSVMYNDDVRHPDPSKLTPEFVAEFQAKFDKLFGSN